METVGKSPYCKTLMVSAAKKEEVLGIFAKEPVPGSVKTRLCPPLSAGEAARLYNASLEETVSRFSGSGIITVIFYAGNKDFFHKAFPDIPLLPQGEGGLGDRMERALRLLLQSGFTKAALIGSDSPDLPISLAEEAFAALQQTEVVTAPSRDGGYVLIGESCHHPDLFCDIPWSTDDVLPATRRCAKKLGISYREVASWEDVDDLASLRRLIERTPASSTAQFAAFNLAHHL